MLGIGRDWVYAAGPSEPHPPCRLGRYVRFRSESIEEWICELERATMDGENEAPGRRIAAAPGMAQEE